MTNIHLNITRGNGILESFLARKRSALANSLIADNLRSGNILDIGCGNIPQFLKSAQFACKYGVDQISLNQENVLNSDGISISHFDINQDRQLPFPDCFFDVITMLAVVEHIEPIKFLSISREIFRILKTGGSFILTTPAPWTDPILRFLALCNLVSSEEIDEHKHQYKHYEIATCLEHSGFQPSKMRFGTFELGMNLWAMANK